MTGNEIRADFRKALNSVENGAELSEKLSWEFSDKDLRNLAMIHRDCPMYRDKIHELLEDCNFHTENADFEAGRYEKYISDKTEERGKKSDVMEKTKIDVRGVENNEIFLVGNDDNDRFLEIDGVLLSFKDISCLKHEIDILEYMDYIRDEWIEHCRDREYSSINSDDDIPRLSESVVRDLAINMLDFIDDVNHGSGTVEEYDELHDKFDEIASRMGLGDERDIDI